MSKKFLTLGFLSLASCLCASAAFADHGMKQGKADIQQAGALAFGPEGVLFVGDSMGAAVFALDTIFKEIMR